MPEIVKNMAKGSWRTNLSGTIALVSVVLAAVKLALDGHFDQINFNQVMEAIGALALAFGLFSARDNKVRSEDVIK